MGPSDVKLIESRLSFSLVVCSLYLYQRFDNMGLRQEKSLTVVPLCIFHLHLGTVKGSVDIWSHASIHSVDVVDRKDNKGGGLESMIIPLTLTEKEVQQANRTMIHGGLERTICM
jgi:hypothetical protein